MGDFRKELLRCHRDAFLCGHETEPHRVSGEPGTFFKYTSNVDAHAFDFFEACEVRECHGNTEIWQCGAEDGPCCKQTWRAPASFVFDVDMPTMRAPKNTREAKTVLDAPVVEVRN